MTFKYNTYTQPFLDLIKKKNTQINIEICYKSADEETLFLRDFALVNPRAYIEGISPEPVVEYYTKAEVDSKLETLEVDLSDYYTKNQVNELIPEVPTKISELENDLGFIKEYIETDPIYKADKPNLALKSELFSGSYNDLTNKPKVPTKISELENDSGFISNYTENDPIYTADKPNIALKSELFSKSYNDLTDKPEIFTPSKDGDGSKYLADDGTYKEVASGGEVDLSNYIGGTNLQYPDGTRYLYTSATNTKQMRIGNTDTNMFSIDLFAQWIQMNIINGGNFNIKDNGSEVFRVNSNELVYNYSYDIQKLKIDDRRGYSSAYDIWSEEDTLILYPDLSDLSIRFYGIKNNFGIVFGLQNGASYSITMDIRDDYGYPPLTNKPFDFQPGKRYIIYQKKNLIFWSELNFDESLNGW